MCSFKPNFKTITSTLKRVLNRQVTVSIYEFKISIKNFFFHKFFFIFITTKSVNGCTFLSRNISKTTAYLVQNVSNAKKKI